MKVNHEITVRQELPRYYEEVPTIGHEPNRSGTGQEALNYTITARWGREPYSSTLTDLPNLPRHALLPMPVVFMSSAAANIRDELRGTWTGVNISDEARASAVAQAFEAGLTFCVIRAVGHYMVDFLENNLGTVPWLAALNTKVPFAGELMGQLFPRNGVIIIQGVFCGIAAGYRDYYEEKEILLKAKQIDAEVLRILDLKDEIDGYMRHDRPEIPAERLRDILGELDRLVKRAGGWLQDASQVAAVELLAHIGKLGHSQTRSAA